MTAARADLPAPDHAALDTARRALENELVLRREERLSVLNAGNGLVIREASGADSHMIRIPTGDAVEIAVRIYTQALTVPPCPHGLRPLPDVPCPTCTPPRGIPS